MLEQQAEITKTIASRLRIDLAGNVADSLQPRAVMSAEAQDAYSEASRPRSRHRRERDLRRQSSFSSKP